MKKEPRCLMAMCCIYVQSLYEHDIYCGLCFFLYTYCKNDIDLHRKWNSFIAECLNINDLNVHFWFASGITSTPAGEEPLIFSFVFQTFSDIDPAFCPCLQSFHSCMPFNVSIISSFPNLFNYVHIIFKWGLISRPTAQGRYLILAVNLQCFLTSPGAKMEEPWRTLNAPHC